jgi:hypothetical protein
LVLAVLLYDIWRLNDFLLKADIDSDIHYAQVRTSSDFVGLVASGLILHDSAAKTSLTLPFGSGNPI